MEQTQASQERCLHGMKRVYCGVCRAPESKPKAARVALTRELSYAISCKDERFLIISGNAGLDDKNLPEDATHVHFAGSPSILVAQKILAIFSHLQVLNFAPCHVRELNLTKYRSLLVKRNITLSFEQVTGKSGTPAEDRLSDPRWLALRGRFFNLSPEHKLRLDELITLGFDEAVVFKWYLQIDCPDDCRISTGDVSRLLKAKVRHWGSVVIRGILHYLDPTDEDHNQVKEFARGLTKRVEEKRKAQSD